MVEVLEQKAAKGNIEETVVECGYCHEPRSEEDIIYFNGRAFCNNPKYGHNSFCQWMSTED